MISVMYIYQIIGNKTNCTRVLSQSLLVASVGSNNHRFSFNLIPNIKETDSKTHTKQCLIFGHTT